MRNELILTLVLYANGGTALPLFVGVHTEAKKSLNRLALVQKPEINLSFTNKGWIAGIFLLYKNLFNIDQYVLGAALGSLSLLVKLLLLIFLCLPFFDHSYKII